MPVPSGFQAQADAWSKQYDAEQAQQQTPAPAQAPPPSSALHWLQRGSSVRVTLDALDSAFTTADQMYDTTLRGERDVAAGAVTGATNIADAGVSLARGIGQNFRRAFSPAAQQDQRAEQAVGEESDAAAKRMDWINEAKSSPIWDHAKAHLLDFRDAVAVQDPTLADTLTQSVAQLAIPFAGYSRLLGGLGAVAKTVAAGALTDSTALGPHDGRLADLLALERQTEGKFGGALRALAPDGSAVNAYINYLTDRTGETEAEGRFKNVLDGFGANLIATPLLHGAATVLKQGGAGLRYLAANGVRNTLSDLASPMRVGRAAQEGKIVFHGTNSDFDQFDAAKIGSGEGNQVYGHGLYFAEDPNVAGHYRQTLSQRTAAGNDSPMGLAQRVLDADGIGGSRPAAVEELNRRIGNATDPNFRSRARQAIDLIKSGAASQRGTLMHVDIPDEKLSQMLDWDAPLSHQTLPDAVASKVGGLGQYNNVRGADVYHELANQMGAKEASAFLRENGVPGIRYLDGGSRSSGGGTRNIVLFDAKHAKIVKKEK